MHDPIRDLESFPTDGVTVSPLPAAEVRRRGDRLRRRNRTVAAVGGVAAVVAVAVPVAVAAGTLGGERSNGPDVVAPSVTGTIDTCDVHGLELRLDGQEDAAGTTWYRVAAHNTGDAACRLATRWTVEHRLYEHERVGPSLVRESPALVLDPGESVHTRIGVASHQSYDAATCRPSVIDNIHVGWGDPNGAWTINRDSRACTTDIQLLRMDPWSAG